MKNYYRIYKNGTTAIYDYKSNGRAMKTIIDTDDLDKLLSINTKWNIDKHSDCYRVKGTVNGKKVYLSRFLMNCPDDLVVDHIDRDTLNNRRSNLRNVTQLVNANNTVRSKSNYVHYDEKINKYRILVDDIAPHQYYGAYDRMDEAIQEVSRVRQMLRSRTLRLLR